jgi:protein SERAC1
MAEDYFQSFGIEHLEVVQIGKPRAKPLADVTFVHGLDGDGLTTWNAGDKTKPKYWPAWLAEDLPQTQVWSLSYPAPKTDWTSSRNRAMALPYRATSVRNLLSSHGIGTRPVMFITHSLGGLLVKQMLRQSAEGANEKGRQLAQETKAVVFLATPHQGSSLASVAGLLSRISRRAVPVGALFRWSAAIR